jgi:hypothetical protein
MIEQLRLLSLKNECLIFSIISHPRPKYIITLKYGYIQ